MARFTRGLIMPVEGLARGVVRFQWNPEATTGPTAEMQWAAVSTAGQELPYLFFGGGAPSRIQFDLVFSRNNNADGYVASQIDRLRALTIPTVGGNVKRPPRVLFVLGKAVDEICVVQAVAPKRGILANPGTLLPYEADVSVTLLKWRN